MTLNLPKVPGYLHVPDTAAGKRTGQHNLLLNLREVPFSAGPNLPKVPRYLHVPDNVAGKFAGQHKLLLNLREVPLREVPC
jgi:hypothetical protein